MSIRASFVLFWRLSGAGAIGAFVCGVLKPGRVLGFRFPLIDLSIHIALRLSV